MSTQLAKQIAARMKAKNLSVLTLEREAGLKTHAVRNILRGKSRRPSAEILQAVADVLGCSIRDLLENQEIFQEDDSADTKDEILNNIFCNSKLLEATVSLVINSLNENKYELSNQQVLTCIEEIYLHSLQKDSDHVDQDFAEWFIELVKD